VKTRYKVSVLALSLTFFCSSLYGFDGDTYDLFLPNGMKVIIMEKHASPNVAVGTFYNVGNRNNIPHNSGITSIVIRAMTSGTKKYPHDRVQSIRGNYGMDDFSIVTDDITMVGSQLPKHELEFLLDLESDRMQNVIFTESSLTYLKNVHKHDINMRDGNVQERSSKIVLNNMLPKGHPYSNSWQGEIEQVDSLSVDICQDFYNRYFTPSNSVLVIVGDVVPDKILPMIYKYFGSINKGSDIPPALDLSFSFNDNTKIPIFFENGGTLVPPGLDLQVLFINFKLPSSRHNDMSVLDALNEIIRLDKYRDKEILNKITKKDRHQKYFFSSIQDRVGQSNMTFIGYNTLKYVLPSKIKESFLDGFRHIAEHGVSQGLIDQYKKSYLNSMYGDYYDFTSDAIALGYAETVWGDYTRYTDELELVKGLKNEDIKRVAKKYLNEDRIYLSNVNVNKPKWYMRLIVGPIYNLMVKINPKLDLYQ